MLDTVPVPRVLVDSTISMLDGYATLCDRESYGSDDIRRLRDALYTLNTDKETS